MAEPIHLWLDDERDPAHPATQKRYGSTGDEVWVKTVPEAMEYLQRCTVESISLDHDLGEGQATGYDLAKWIEKQAYNWTIPPFKWEVHSSNPSGAFNIRMALSAANKFWKTKAPVAHSCVEGGDITPIPALVCSRCRGEGVEYTLYELVCLINDAK